MTYSLLLGKFEVGETPEESALGIYENTRREWFCKVWREGVSDHFGVSGKDEPTFIQKQGERTQDGGIVWTNAGKPKSLSETMAAQAAADAAASHGSQVRKSLLLDNGGNTAL